MNATTDAVDLAKSVFQLAWLMLLGEWLKPIQTWCYSNASSSRPDSTRLAAGWSPLFHMIYTVGQLHKYSADSSP